MRNQRGFTLIELMIVIVILGILAAISMANFFSMKENSERASCLTNQRHILEGTILYIAERNVSDEVINVTLPLPPNPTQTQKSSPNLTDGFLGLRYIGRIGNKWGYSIRGDVGTGDTELTLNGKAFFKYQIGQSGRYGLLLGYRYMNLELKEKAEGVDIETDLTYSGPVFGFMFKW